MLQPIPAPHKFPLGIQSFLELEQRVSDIEKTLDLMKELLNANNDSLQSILTVIEQANASKS